MEELETGSTYVKPEVLIWLMDLNSNVLSASSGGGNNGNSASDFLEGKRWF